MADELQDGQHELPPSVNRLDADLWAYEQLVRIEHHWTDQTQNQQRRITAVLAVNGFLLAFLAAAGFQVTTRPFSGWYLYPFYVCLILLSLALVFGVLTLLPRISISGKDPGARGWIYENLLSTTASGDPSLWLDAQSVLREFRRARETGEFDQFVLQMCASVAGNANGNLEHRDTLSRRRRWMHWQIAFIMVSLALLIIAVVGLAIHVL
jgi:hypothetical protein